ncbi:MAG TPA: LysM domain-containing protein [Phycisphaerae bacterium]
MTREAKIGMLTGLGVIVMIGVLLSSYLGDPKAGAVGTAYTTGRMADLGVGDAYRQQVMQPVGVPPLAGPGPRTQQYPGGAEIASPIDGSDRAAPPAAFATESAPHPAAVAAVPAGPAMDPTYARVDGPPVISLAEPLVPAKALGTSQPPAFAAPTQTTYTVSAGDSLGKIAKKFYNSSKTSDVQRIVAANPTLLKDSSTMLVIGKTLVIPGVAPAAAKDRALQPPTVYLPGDAGKPAPAIDPNRKVQPPTTAKTTLYVVQSGDTLEKISRRIAPTKVNDTVQKLISLNSLKDPKNLQVGAKLKVPA